jgi:SH3-like domain-containing protein
VMGYGAFGRSLVGVGCLGLLLSVVLPVVPASSASAAAGVQVGKSGLPLPRFVSLKSSRVNVRVGPGDDYKIAWVFTRPELPVEIVQEFDNWRRIRDSDGSMGWVFHSLLSGKRTATVSPWSSDEPRPIRANASESARVTAYLQPGVTAAVDTCESGWCRLSGRGFRGWIEQEQLWGVYVDEVID